MVVGLTLETSKDLTDFLEKNINAMPKVQEVVQINTAEMQTNAQRKAPFDTGTLKRSIELDIKQEGNSVVGEVGSVGAGSEYEPYQEYGTRYQPGKPHIRPAYYEQRDKFRQDMYEVVKDK